MTSGEFLIPGNEEAGHQVARDRAEAAHQCALPDVDDQYHMFRRPRSNLSTADHHLGAVWRCCHCNQYWYGVKMGVSVYWVRVSWRRVRRILRRDQRRGR